MPRNDCRFQLAKRLRHSSETVVQIELLKGDKGNSRAFSIIMLLVDFIYAVLFWQSLVSVPIKFHCSRVACA